MVGFPTVQLGATEKYPALKVQLQAPTEQVQLPLKKFPSSLDTTPAADSLALTTAGLFNPSVVTTSLNVPCIVRVAVKSAPVFAQDIVNALAVAILSSAVVATIVVADVGFTVQVLSSKSLLPLTEHVQFGVTVKPVTVKV
jgi:hypothetical protein